MAVGFEIGMDGVVEFARSFGVCFGGEEPESGSFKIQRNRRRT